MTKIFVIRHAEAEGNLYRRIHGQYEGGITANGYRQIKALEARFRDIPIDACYSSDLIRTQITASAIYKPKGLPLQLEPCFREVHLGRWENVPFGILYTFELESIKMFDAQPELWQVEGSETFDQYTTRFINGLTRIGEAHPQGSVCVFSHGAVIRGILRKLFPGRSVGHSDNTAVTLLTYENGSFHAEYINDNSHLDESISTLAKQNWWKKDENVRKTDHNLWFKEGMTALDGLTPMEDGFLFTAILGETPVGQLCLRDVDDVTGELVYMGLVPAYRGQHLAVQLLGQAVFFFRHMGKKRILLRLPENHTVMEQFCSGCGMKLLQDRIYELDIRLPKSCM